MCLGLIWQTMSNGLRFRNGLRLLFHPAILVPIVLICLLVGKLIAANGNLRQRQYERASLPVRKKIAELDTVYRTDTVRMTRHVTRYVTQRETDTIVRNDTVYVKRYLADSAIAGCQSVVLTCEARVQALLHSLAIAESTIRVWPEPVRHKTSLTAIVYAATLGAIAMAVVMK